MSHRKGKYGHISSTRWVEIVEAAMPPETRDRDQAGLLVMSCRTKGQVVYWLNTRWGSRLTEDVLLGRVQLEDVPARIAAENAELEELRATHRRQRAELYQLVGKSPANM